MNHLEQKGMSQYPSPGHLPYISSLALPKGKIYEIFFFFLIKTGSTIKSTSLAAKKLLAKISIYAESKNS